jgi:hypothetical protein
LKVIQVVEKVNIELPDDPEITLLDMHPKQQISQGPRRPHPDVQCNTNYSS